MSKRRKKVPYRKQSRLVIAAILLVAVFACGGLLLMTKSIKEKEDSYKTQAQELEEQIDEAKQESESLEEEEVYTKTQKYVEDMARSKLGLVKPGETYLKPSEEE